jgi:hypothetical protein
MSRQYLVGSAVLLFLIGTAVFWALFRTPETTPQENILPPLPDSPLNATYRIEDQEVTLTAGMALEPIHDSSSQVETLVFGEPIVGDINGDGTEDAVLLLTQRTGGSGTFYYVAVAVKDESGFIGSNAILLGDRIAPQNIEIRDDVVVVNYAQHAEDQSFADAPSEAVSAYLTLAGAKLMRTDVSGMGVQVLSGELVYGHESRTFRPCGGEAYWIATTSRARAALQAIYEERVKGKEPYTPVYMVVAGTVGEGLTDGFGADFEHRIDISTIVSAPEQGTCTHTPATSSLDEMQ